MVDFKADLRDAAIELLETYHVKYKASDDVYALLKRLCTFEEKYIKPQKREVLMSEELSKNLGMYPKSVQIAFEKITEWVKEGVDINCFQSRGLYGKGARDYQNMRYGIVHLHLSAGKDDMEPVIKKDRFAKPGKHLLFARFDKEKAYFVKIVKHPQSFGEDGNIEQEWISTELLKILKRNWPELFMNFNAAEMHLCDADGNPIDLDNKAIATLTSSHTNTLPIFEGSLYTAGLGMTCAGDSLRASVKANHIANNVEIARIFFEKYEAEICKEFERLLKTCGQPVPATYDIHYDYVEDRNQFLIVDRKSCIVYDCRNGKMYLACDSESSQMP